MNQNKQAREIVARINWELRRQSRRLPELRIPPHIVEAAKKQGVIIRGIK